MPQKSLIKNVIIFALVFLWVYAAASKMSDFNMFKGQMHRQVLPLFLKVSLVYILPAVELVTALLLLFDCTQLIGLLISLGLMSAFTVYISGAVFRFYDKIPCSCGGVLSSMGWDAHFIFNLFFLLLAAVGLIIRYRERRQRRNG